MPELTEQKQQARNMWAGGEYHQIVEKIASAGAATVEAAQLSGGEKVLDVACGTGNATIPAAKAGAEVTGLDLTPRLLEQGKEAASAAGVEIEWIEGDAEQLPFEDESFDVVMSVFGCMFAPDQQRAASEIARVLKPGGRMAIAAWTPDGNIGKMFILIGSHMPPPPEGFQPPVLWGSEEHVRGLFGGTRVEPNFQQREVIFEGESPEAFLEEYERKLPPIVAAKAALEPEGKWDALRAELLERYKAENESDDAYRSLGEYLVTTGEKG